MLEYDKLVEIVNACSEEVEKCENGNKAAGTRLRKLMQDVKKQTQVVRQKILESREKDKK